MHIKTHYYSYSFIPFLFFFLPYLYSSLKCPIKIYIKTHIAKISNSKAIKYVGNINQSIRQKKLPHCPEMTKGTMCYRQKHGLKVSSSKKLDLNI